MKNVVVFLLLSLGISLNVLSQTRDLVVIDESIQDIDLLKSSILRQADILLVNNQSEVWFEIYQAISDQPAITQVHLLLPSSEGELVIGGTSYDVNTISEVFDLKLLKNKEISLLFYGSNLAEIEEGKALVNKIAEITNLDISASTTTTAGKDAGGDWLLEYHTGNSAEYDPIFNDESLKNYPYNF
ncbi:DUF4347 domain-containing protein [Saccharicrinis sp. FJH54]|uniref:DUF4347 domain-containing protein n=1 Tax=Saccharicrinis sp. FJH54 TaxID=3344665 RepID=UPI0035D463FB